MVKTPYEDKYEVRVGRIRQDLSTQCSGQKGKFRPNSEIFSYSVKIYRLFSIMVKFFEEIEKVRKNDFTKARYQRKLIKKVKNV